MSCVRASRPCARVALAAAVFAFSCAAGLAGPREANAAATVRGSLDRMRASGQLDPTEHAARVKSYSSALAARAALSASRRRELAAVIGNLQEIAAAGKLTRSRVPALFATLDANRRWWTRGPLLCAGRRVQFAGSELIWQYYPGQGIQLQMLANFGRANAYWSTTKHDAELRVLLDELVPLASERDGGLAWEYQFSFGGGHPPWISGLTQGTAVQVLARAAARLGRPELLAVGRRALRAFELAPPRGVRLKTPAGAHYLLYSFNKRLRVLNGFIQALNGLHEFATLAPDPVARELFDSGNAQARLELPRHDTGSWSLYSLRGARSDLGYHKLVTGFLRDLCARTGERLYCGAARRFRAYLSGPGRPPAVPGSFTCPRSYARLDR